jgi:hypothetical protein
MDDVQQKQFMQDLVLLVVKNYLLFNLCIEHGWNILHAFMLFKNCVSFKKIGFRKSVYVQSQKYVKSIKLVEYCSTKTNFDLWMSKKTHNIFVLVINFLRVNWQPKRIAMSLFQVNQITRQVLSINLIFSFFFLIILIILFFELQEKCLNLILF